MFLDSAPRSFHNSQCIQGFSCLFRYEFDSVRVPNGTGGLKWIFSGKCNFGFDKIVTVLCVISDSDELKNPLTSFLFGLFNRSCYFCFGFCVEETMCLFIWRARYACLVFHVDLFIVENADRIVLEHELADGQIMTPFVTIMTNKVTPACLPTGVFVFVSVLSRYCGGAYYLVIRKRLLSLTVSVQYQQLFRSFLFR